MDSNFLSTVSKSQFRLVILFLNRYGKTENSQDFKIYLSLIRNIYLEM